VTVHGDGYLKAVEAFNQTGSLDEVVATMDGSVVFHSSTGADLNGTKEVTEALNALKSRTSWTGQEVLSTTESEGWMATLFRNQYAGGKQAIGGGILRFNDQGRVVEVWAHVHHPD